MTDKAHLRDKLVLFRLINTNVVYSGVVRYVEDDGFWIETRDLMSDLANDPAWQQTFVTAFGTNQKPPVIFVPVASLLFLMAAQT